MHKRIYLAGGDRVHCRCGGDVLGGSKTPPEIAVAILAEMTAVRHGVDLAAVGSEDSKRVSIDGNQAVCVTSTA